MATIRSGVRAKERTLIARLQKRRTKKNAAKRLAAWLTPQAVKMRRDGELWQKAHPTKAEAQRRALRQAAGF